MRPGTTGVSAPLPPARGWVPHSFPLPSTARNARPTIAGSAKTAVQPGSSSKTAPGMLAASSRARVIGWFESPQHPRTAAGGRPRTGPSGPGRTSTRDSLKRGGEARGSCERCICRTTAMTSAARRGSGAGAARSLQDPSVPSRSISVPRPARRAPSGFGSRPKAGPRGGGLDRSGRRAAKIRGVAAPMDSPPMMARWIPRRPGSSRRRRPWLPGRRGKDRGWVSSRRGRAGRRR